MICTLVGVERKSGDYNGRSYDNLLCYFITDLDSAESTGSRVLFPDQTKVKLSDVPKIFRGISSYHDVFGLVGTQFDVFFNEYKRLDSVLSI